MPSNASSGGAPSPCQSSWARVWWTSSSSSVWSGSWWKSSSLLTPVIDPNETACEALVEAAHRGRRPPDVHLRLGVEDRREEPDSLDVVEVEMREAEVDRTGAVLDEPAAERTDARAGVQDDAGAVVAFDLDARGVA